MGIGAFFVALAGCMSDLYDDEKEYKKFGLTEEDLKAPPSSNEVRARIITDARRWRMLREKLDSGRAACAEIVVEGGKAMCVADKTALQVIQFPGSDPGEVNRAVETAYYCPKESVYYYHYRGGAERRNVWLGPYTVRWNRGGEK